MRRIEIRARGLVESLFSGEYRSVFKGRGMEFADVREYQPGDDVGTIDWNVTARLGRPFVKEHVESRELTVLLVVDLSASKEFGTGPEANVVVASEIAAILMLAAAGNNDRVGLLLVTDRVEAFLSPQSGRRHALRLVLELLSFRPSGTGTRLSAGLEYAYKVLPRRATIFLVSDFLTDSASDASLEWSLGRVARDHDLVPVRLTDPATDILPDVGVLAAFDPESGRRRLVNTSRAAVRRAYADERARQRSAMSSLLRTLRLDVVEVVTHDDHVLPLLRFFRQRGRARR